MHHSQILGASQADAAPPRPIAPPIWFLALCTASAIVGLTILTAILPLIKSDLSASSAQVQLLFTSYMFALALGQLVFGPVSDRYGRRPVLLFGAALYTLGGVAVVVAKDIQLLVLWRVVQGFGAAACIAMGRAMVNDAFERSNAARQMSTISMVVAIAPAVSIGFGGWLAMAVGWKSTMVLLTVLGLMVLLFAYFSMTETNQHRLVKFNPASISAAYGRVLRNPSFVCWTMASGMQIGIFFCFNSILAYQYQRNGYSLAEFGLWFSLTPLAYIVGNTVNRMQFVNKNIERAALIGCCIGTVAIALMLVTQLLGYTHALSLALPCCLFGFSNGIVVANATAGAISAAGKDAGTGTGIVGAWQMATGGIAGAIIIALGGDEVFTIAAVGVLVMSVVSVLTMVVVFRLRRLE